MSVVDLFCSLARLPSPSLHEDAVAEKIVALLTSFGARAARDAYGNVKGFVAPTDASRKPLMLTGHMDVVGDDSPVVIRHSADGVFLETDKTRTLGADDKAGVACALSLAQYLCAHPELKHGGLELVFTRDEEVGMTGARAVDFSDTRSEYVLVLDAESVGEFQIAGAGYTKLTVSVTGTKGGHSGLDIADDSRVNAVKVLGEAVSLIPQGVYYADDKGVVTSINIGAVAGGGLKNEPTETSGAGFCSFLAENAMTNIINTDAFAAYSIRSADRRVENALKNDIQAIVDGLNEKYAGRATIAATFAEHVKPFEASSDKTMVNVFLQAAKTCGITPHISSFHAAAETHVYAYCKNANGKVLKPYLVGAANIHNMHSSDEKVEIASMEQGAALIKAVFIAFNA